jgi:hypothetical protein
MLGSNFVRRIVTSAVSAVADRGRGHDRQRRPNVFRPQLENLEGRLVPAGWEWTPSDKGVTDGANAANWVNAATGANGLPAAGDTVIFSNNFGMNGNNNCKLAPNIGKVSVLVQDTVTGKADNYSGTISAPGTTNQAFAGTYVALTASPTFDTTGNQWDFGSGFSYSNTPYSTQLTGKIQTTKADGTPNPVGSVIVSPGETQTWVSLALAVSVTNSASLPDDGGSVTVSNNITYQPTGIAYVFDNDGTLTLGPSTTFASDQNGNGQATKYFEPLRNDVSGSLYLSAGNTTINSWIDNFGKVNIGSVTQVATVSVSGFDPNSKASVVGEAGGTLIVAAPLGATTKFTESPITSNAYYGMGLSRLTVAGAGTVQMTGNLALIGNADYTAALYFNGNVTSDTLSVVGDVTLDYAYVKMNLVYPAQANQNVTANEFKCFKLTFKDTNELFVFASGGPAIAFNNLGFGLISTVGGNPAGDFSTYVLPSGVTAKWNNGSLDLTGN